MVNADYHRVTVWWEFYRTGKTGHIRGWLHFSGFCL